MRFVDLYDIHKNGLDAVETINNVFKNQSIDTVTINKNNLGYLKEYLRRTRNSTDLKDFDLKNKYKSITVLCYDYSFLFMPSKINKLFLDN